MIHLKTYKLFETGVLSKSRQKVEKWKANNPTPTGTVISTDDVLSYGVPKKIVDMMENWDVIYKSPYSKSFYSSTDISWSYKPDGSFRVSDHWNFTSNRDNKVHCKSDKTVPGNNTHFRSI